MNLDLNLKSNFSGLEIAEIIIVSIILAVSCSVLIYKIIKY